MNEGSGERMTDEVRRVVDARRAWARRTGRELGPGGASLLRLEDALCGGALDGATRAELTAGAGGEMRRLPSLRSSSALAVNVFGPWRSDPAPLSGALGGPSTASALRFEGVFPTGLGGIPPHLDVVIEGPDALVAIESKFLESYAPVSNAFRPSYFESDALWSGFTACRGLAEAFVAGDGGFQWLGAAQLIKHALGLSKTGRPFRLLLVWYRVDGRVADALDREIERFAETVAPDFEFEALTHQELHKRLSALPAPVEGYVECLRERYFELDIPDEPCGPAESRLGATDQASPSIRPDRGIG